MVSYILLVISICFIIGAAAVTVINRKNGGDASARWVKYIAYLFVVYGMLWLMHLDSWYFPVAASVVAAAGYYELLVTGIGKGYRLLIRAMLLYTLLVAGFAGLIYNASSGTLLMIYFLVILFDGFSQLCGQLFGRRKLAPVTSPNKTIEGFIGGWVITLLCSAYLLWSFIACDISLLIFWIMACPVALAGDLAASYYKRRAGVKDYSNLIPGHGGVLDRFDSLLAVGAFYFLINFMAG